MPYDLPGDPGLPPGVSERDISYPDPVECPLCKGEGEINATPCCGSPFVDMGTDFKCFRCVERYASRDCPECGGEGVVE
jgi:DnaJ-class molecular chaperone